MKQHKIIATLVAVSIISTGFITGRLQAQTEIDIQKDIQIYGNQPIPIALKGYSGEVAKVLEFDLEVQGFAVVGEDKAGFVLTGQNASRVEGRLTAAGSSKEILAKAYSGASMRVQAHALSDDVVEAITGRKGIARTRIAFKVDTGRTSEIYVSDYDGHNATAVTRDGSIVAAPSWVPGKLGLYYTSYKSGNPDIYAHNLSTGDRQPIARYSGLNTSAAVSPDGTRVAMILSRAGSPDVYVSDINGGNLKRLTTSKEGESSPCWSPDGRTICFSSKAGGRSALYTVPADGGSMKRLTTSGVLNATEPDWSPDGKTIVFTSLMGGFNICTVPATGGTATVLTAGEDPYWAPNSRTVIFARRAGGERVLSLLDVPTKRTKTVPRISGSNSQPAWAR